MKYEIKCNFKCITRTQNREVVVTKTKLSMALFKEDWALIKTDFVCKLGVYDPEVEPSK